MFIIYIVLFLLALYLLASSLFKMSYSMAFTFMTYLIVVSFVLDNGILLFLSIIGGLYLMNFIRKTRRDLRNETQEIYNRGREQARHDKIFDRGFRDEYFRN